MWWLSFSVQEEREYLRVCQKTAEAREEMNGESKEIEEDKYSKEHDREVNGVALIKVEAYREIEIKEEKIYDTTQWVATKNLNYSHF